MVMKGVVIRPHRVCWYWKCCCIYFKEDGLGFLSIATGFSAGVMLYDSIDEIFLKGVDTLASVYSDDWGHWINTATFFDGMLIIDLGDNLIPTSENPLKHILKMKQCPFTIRRLQPLILKCLSVKGRTSWREGNTIIDSNIKSS